MYRRQLYALEGIQVSKETVDCQNITGALAWAAEHKVSYEVALKSLVSQSAPLIFRIIAFIFSLGHSTLKRRTGDDYYRKGFKGTKPFFRNAIEATISDLNSGYSLSEALNNNLYFWLPKFYIESVRIGEEKGCLRETLCQLSETTSKVTRRRKELFSVLVYPFLIAFFGFIIIWGLSVFIIPKFKRIFDDLLGGEALPGLTEFIMHLVDFIIPQNPIIFLGIIQIPWLIYYFGCTHRLDWILVKIPFIRRSVLRWQMIDALQALAVFTRMKIPMDQALDMICDYQPYSCLKRKLLKLKDDVKKGIAFEKSWLQNFPKDNISNFYIQSGITGDNLPECLDRLVNTLQDHDNRKYALTLKISEPLMLIFISIIIGIVVLGMFMPMIFIINKMTMGS